MAINSYSLSLYFGFHDSSITISDGKRVLLHLEAERFFRKKHIHINENQMQELIFAGLSHLNMTITDISKVFLAKRNNQFVGNEVKLLGKTFTPKFTSHHNNHIGTVLHRLPEDCLIVCGDGGSEDGTTKFYLKKDNRIELLQDFDNEIITGKFYGTITQMIIHPNVGRAHDTYPGKLMGLSALGSYSQEYRNLFDEFGAEINKLHKDGVEHLHKVFGLSNNYSDYWQDQKRIDLAHTAQLYWQTKFIEAIGKYKHLSKSIALVGGCALNVILNTEIHKLGYFDSIITTPVPCDSGQSLGALLFHNPMLICKEPHLGRGFGEIEEESFDYTTIITDLLKGKIIGRFQGKSEVGPRALGHRSFIGIPTSLDLKHKLSIEVKGREGYRPVAPIVLQEYVSDYFDIDCDSEFMSFSPKAKDDFINKAPAVIHVDGTARLQTLTYTQNPVLYNIIKMVGDVTGVYALMNSSFNVDGEPIVDTPSDAIRTFYNSKVDLLYINGVRYEK